MIELGQLESHSKEFEKRNVRVVAVSIEDLKLARETQADFPHLQVVSDHERKLTEAVGVFHAASAPDGGDTSAPTTLLIDGDGTVRWMFRSSNVFSRLSPADLLAAIDQKMPNP